MNLFLEDHFFRLHFQGYFSVLKIQEYLDIPFKDKGRDFDGCDCWGLIRLIYNHEYNIQIPSFNEDYSSTIEREILAKISDREKHNWILVKYRFKEGDVLLLRVLGLPIHVGLIIEPYNMIHIMKGINSCVERFNSTIWRKRILGIYRHVERC